MGKIVSTILLILISFSFLGFANSAEDKAKVKVIIIPDIESINYGRGVGYEIIEHEPPQDIGEISATEIRKKMFK